MVKRQTISIYNWKKGEGEEKEYVLFTDYQALSSALDQAKKVIEERGYAFQEAQNKTLLKLQDAKDELDAANKRVKAWEIIGEKLASLDIQDAKKELERIETERDELKTKVAELTESQNKAICVWCKHVGKKDSEEFYQHVRNCVNHPIKKMIDDFQAKQIDVEKVLEEGINRAIKDLTKEIQVLTLANDLAETQIEELVKERHAFRKLLEWFYGCVHNHLDSDENKDLKKITRDCNVMKAVEEALGMGGKERKEDCHESVMDQMHDNDKPPTIKK
jgi:hypothetical protein